MSSKRTVIWLIVCFAEFVIVYVVVASSSSINVVENAEVVVSGDDDDDGLFGTVWSLPESGNISSSSVAINSTRLQRRRRCNPVPHDVLWRRLQVSSVPDDDQSSWSDDDDEQNVDAASETSHDRVVDAGSKRNDEMQTVSLSKTANASPDVNNDADDGFPRDADTAESFRSRRAAVKDGRRRRKERHGRRRNRKSGGKNRLVHRDNGLNGSHPTLDLPPKEFRRASWHCRLEKRWKRMPPGVFPAYVQTGTCRRQSTCMMGLYECRPRRYRIKVLRRVDQTGSGDNGCNPLANIGPTVEYEETWHMVERKVIVGCECSRKRFTGSYHRAENG